MKCPNCGKLKIKTIKKASSQEIKGEELEVISEAWECSSCHFHFYDDKMMDKLALTASNAYRNKHGLLISSQLIELRNQFGMTQNQFADFLGVGIASIKRWEGIGIQDLAMDKLIRLKCQPEAGQAAAMEIEEKTQAGILNGNRSFSKEKYFALYQISLREGKSPLFANKIMWYCDFAHHRKYEKGITGSMYLRQDWGPVPLNAHLRIEEMVESGYIAPDKGHNFKLLKKPDLSVFGEDELNTINEVLKFTKGRLKKLPDLTHEELGWIQTRALKPISYEYSKILKARV